MEDKYVPLREKCIPGFADVQLTQSPTTLRYWISIKYTEGMEDLIDAGTDFENAVERFDAAYAELYEGLPYLP